MLRDPGALTRSEPATAAVDDADDPVSVGFVGPGWPLDTCANGVATYIAAIMPELRRMGHAAHILAEVAGGVDQPVPETVLDLGSNDDRPPPARLLDRLTRRLDPGGEVHRRHCRAVLRAARRMADKPGPHVLEMEEAFGWPRRVHPRCPMPLVVRLHGPWFLNGPNNGDDPAGLGFARRVREEGLGIAAADGVTAPSRDVLERTRDHYGLTLEGAEVIPYPTPSVPLDRRWRPDGCEPESILFVGRFDRHKGGDTIIDAFAQLHRDRPAARLTLVGPDRGLQRDGRTWSLTEYVDHRLPGALADGRVRWLGRRPHAELGELRRRAAVVVVASRYETFGLTISEAMAVGCPVVATRAGGAAEVFDDGVHGLYCEPDDPGGLADRIASMLANPDRAAAMGRSAAVECERRYSPATVAARTVDFYRRVLARAAGTPRAGRP